MSEWMDALAVPTQAVVLTGCALLLLGVGRKASLLARGKAEDEVAVAWVTGRGGIAASGVLILAAMIEAAVLVLLVTWPALGLWLFVALMIAYIAVLSRLSADQECGCFGDLLPTTNRGAMVRNSTLAVAAAVGGVVAATHDVRAHLFAQVPVGVTLILLALAVGAAHVTPSRSLKATVDHRR